MTATYKNDLLFDDLTLLQQHISPSRLMASSVNANCDCAVAPVLTAHSDFVSISASAPYDDHHTD